MSQKATCPDCLGTGGNHVLVNMGGFCEHRNMTCSRCGGTGTIAQNLLSWTAQGEAMRQDRVGRKLSLSAEAQRIGIHPAELSGMEHGTIRPFDYEDLKNQMEPGPRALGKEKA